MITALGNPGAYEPVMVGITRDALVQITIPVDDDVVYLDFTPKHAAHFAAQLEAAIVAARKLIEAN